MSTQTDIKTIQVTGAGPLFLTTPGQGLRLKGIFYNATTGGTFSIADNTTAQVYFAATVPVGKGYIGPFPGEGVRCANDIRSVFATFAGSLTLFYG